mmetsp:Transcript_4631/g.18470  ORF Transcript_4631/g.18470 Transcript_4631/m.18470 type:complete len:105 (-) Transcript_4631:3394-3708(-)
MSFAIPLVLEDQGDEASANGIGRRLLDESSTGHEEALLLSYIVFGHFVSWCRLLIHGMFLNEADEASKLPEYHEPATHADQHNGSHTDIQVLARRKHPSLVASA